MEDNVSPFFARSEFACKCGCGFDTVDTETLNILNSVRKRFGPVVVTSGCRCESHNAAIGGSPNSQHKLARAADIQVKDVEPESVYKFVDEIYPEASLGLYDTFVHVDTRSNGPARWDMRD